MTNEVSPPRLREVLPSLRQRLFEPVDIASIVFFRIAFGVAMVTNNLWYLRNGRVYEYYVEPDMHFPYGVLTFIDPLPGIGMHLVYVGMAVTGTLIALGLRTRWSAAVLFVLTTYVFLLDSTFFQNHEYLISLLSLLLIFLPTDRMWSLDARRRDARGAQPSQPPTVPVWVVWFLRFQIGVPYVYGGIAKLNADWLRAEPLRMWLHRRTDWPVIGSRSVSFDEVLPPPVLVTASASSEGAGGLVSCTLLIRTE
jgi:vitamin K-dependent gamma-carboxylase